MSHPGRQACTSRPAVAGARGPADGPAAAASEQRGRAGARRVHRCNAILA